MADYLAVRLAMERIHAQHLSARHFKNEATLYGIRGYLHHHPAELLVRLALFEGRGNRARSGWNFCVIKSSNPQRRPFTI